MRQINKAYALKKIADENGFLPVFNALGKNIHVTLPMHESFYQMSTDELDLSVRARNCLRRSNAHTVELVTDLIMSETGLKSIRNLGEKSIREIKTSILVCAYEQLTDSEKLQFWDTVLKDNCL